MCMMMCRQWYSPHLITVPRTKGMQYQDFLSRWIQTGCFCSYGWFTVCKTSCSTPATTCLGIVLWLSRNENGSGLEAPWVKFCSVFRFSGNSCAVCLFARLQPFRWRSLLGAVCLCVGLRLNAGRKFSACWSFRSFRPLVSNQCGPKPVCLAGFRR